MRGRSDQGAGEKSGVEGLVTLQGKGKGRERKVKAECEFGHLSFQELR